MPLLDFLLPVLYVIFLWWFTTGVIIAMYGRSQQFMGQAFGWATLLLVVAFGGLIATRDLTTTRGVYIATTCGVVIWGWQVTAYYLGFVNGPGNANDIPEHGRKPNLSDRFRLALNMTIHHELLVICFGLLMLALTAPYANRWGLWMYIALWLMHTSAKVNVFLGVRNFDVSFLPERMKHIDKLISKRENNAWFPLSIVLASSVTFVLVYQAIRPDANPASADGFLIIATMIFLGIIEHTLLILPIPSTLVGFGLRSLPEASDPRMNRVLAPAYATTNHRHTLPHKWEPMPMMYAAAVKPSAVPIATKRTLTFNRHHGPLVVDVWEPADPTSVIPIVLVHGWGGSGSYWRDTARELSRYTRVIVPDLPGTGRSQPVKNSQDMFNQVDTLADMLDLLELERVQLVTHSMGGAMGLLLSDQVPEKIDRVVLTSTAFFLTEAQYRIYTNIMKVYRLSMGFRPMWLVEVPGLKELLASQYFYNIPDDEAALRQGLRDYLQLDAGTAIACAANAPDPRIPQAGARLQAPALLIACNQDRVMPLENVDYTVETIPDCHAVWIDDCGHLPMVEKPDEYMAILQDFLDLGGQI